MSYKNWGVGKKQTVKSNVTNSSGRIRGVTIRKGDTIITVKRSDVLSLITALIVIGLK